MSDKKLPKGWKWVTLGDECEFTQGIQVNIDKQKFEKFENSVQFLRIIDFTQNNEPPRYIENPGERYLLNKNEIAMVRYGTVGFVCINKIGAIANNLFKINPSDNINSKYLINFFNSLSFSSKLVTKGATMQALSFGLIKPITLPLPPLETQQAIVSKIEELFSELDKGIVDLKTAQQQLKTYRQSVLKWAFEGKLTNQNVKDGTLPKGWKIVKLDKVADISSSKRIFKHEYVNEGVPFFRTKEVKELSEGKELSIELYISNDKYEEIKSKFKIPQIGDILLSAVGTIGISYVIKDEKPFYFKDGNLMWFRDLKDIDSYYLHYGLVNFIRNGQGANTSGSAYNALTISTMKDFDFPLPQIEEQHHIVQEIESRISVANKMEESIAHSLLQADSLRQSILKKAFSGELV